MNKQQRLEAITAYIKLHPGYHYHCFIGKRDELLKNDKTCRILNSKNAIKFITEHPEAQLFRYVNIKSEKFDKKTSRMKKYVQDSDIAYFVADIDKNTESLQTCQDLDRRMKALGINATEIINTSPNSFQASFTIDQLELVKDKLSRHLDPGHSLSMTSANNWKIPVSFCAHRMKDYIVSTSECYAIETRDLHPSRVKSNVTELFAQPAQRETIDTKHFHDQVVEKVLEQLPFIKHPDHILARKTFITCIVEDLGLNLTVGYGIATTTLAEKCGRSKQAAANFLNLLVKQGIIVKLRSHFFSSQHKQAAIYQWANADILAIYEEVEFEDRIFTPYIQGQQRRQHILDDVRRLYILGALEHEVVNIVDAKQQRCKCSKFQRYELAGIFTDWVSKSPRAATSRNDIFIQKLANYWKADIKVQRIFLKADAESAEIVYPQVFE